MIEEDISILLIEHDMKLCDENLRPGHCDGLRKKKLPRGHLKEIRSNPLVIKAYLGEEFVA